MADMLLRRIIEHLKTQNWTAVGLDLAIVIVGVFVGTQVSNWNQARIGREDVAQLRSALIGELADDRARWEYMIDGDRCTLTRLDALDRWLTTAPPAGRLSGSFPILALNLHSSSWDLAKTNAAMARMPLEERLTYASLYAALENWRELLRNEVSNTQTIAAMLETANRPENRRQIAALLSRARSLVRFRQASSPYIIRRFDQLGVRPDVRTLVGAIDPQELCEPLTN